MIARVIVDISSSDVDRVFDYSCIDEYSLGSRVLVPFGNRQVEGFIIAVSEKTEVDPAKLKSIIKMLDDRPVISAELLQIMSFMAAKYHLRLADILRLFIPAELRGGRVKELVRKCAKIRDGMAYEEASSLIKRGSDKQKDILEYLETNGSALVADIGREYSLSALNTLAKHGIIVIEDCGVGRVPYKNIIPEYPETFKLTNEQITAYEAISGAGGRHTFVLHGVTGSGKTEVYVKCISDCLRSGKTAVMLVPEISLTPQTFKYFKERFGDTVAILHSGLSAGERYDEWRRLLTGSAMIAIGARSAIFAPLTNIGMIIIDEEHDSSYISESNPRYDTLDIAFKRSEYNDCPLVLGSATPSVNTYFLAQSGEYTLLQLKKRINNLPLPEIRIVDMLPQMRQGSDGLYSNVLLSEIADCISSGRQAMVFLNRRGYASYQRCMSCDYVYKCDDCDISLVYHSAGGFYKCHYCNRTYPVKTHCSVCGSEFMRLGSAGTQKLEEELIKYVPNAKILRMDNDTTRNKDGHFKILSRFLAKEANVLIGTQMIAKGHNFPEVTLVGIIDADQSLYFSDFRASEKTYQLITQVSGRAGRADMPGKVILQTFSPGHYVYRHAVEGDYKGFYEREINIRKVTQYPPYSIILRILVQGEDEELAIANLKLMYDDLKVIRDELPDAFIYLKAMKSYIKKIQNLFRVQILMRIKGGDSDLIIQRLYSIMDKHRNKKLQCFAEINPQSLS